MLPAHLTQAAGGGIGITVEDAGAVYPVTVDPFVQTQTLAVSGTRYFGASVALSADGSTAIVGAYVTNNLTGAAYVFTNLALTSFSPPTGPTTGGTTVMVRGINFTGTTAVKFGDVAGTNIFVNIDGSSLIVTAPAHAAGGVEIVVTAHGQTATISGYTYLATGGIAPQPTPHATAVSGAGGVPTPQPTPHSTVPTATSVPLAQPDRH